MDGLLERRRCKGRFHVLPRLPVLVEGIKAIRNSELGVKSLQEWLVEIAN
ncbi:MAG: hypothetical protein RLY80_559 [Actinomycetota bacterium]